MNYYNLSKALRYSMDTVTNLLEQLHQPNMFSTRLGGKGADHTFRGILADAIAESNRPHRELEASLLRDPNQHVIYHNYMVRPGCVSLTQHYNKLAGLDYLVDHKLGGTLRGPIGVSASDSPHELHNKTQERINNLDAHVQANAAKTLASKPNLKAKYTKLINDLRTTGVEVLDTKHPTEVDTRPSEM